VTLRRRIKIHIIWYFNPEDPLVHVCQLEAMTSPTDPRFIPCKTKPISEQGDEKEQQGNTCFQASSNIRSRKHRPTPDKVEIVITSAPVTWKWSRLCQCNHLLLSTVWSIRWFTQIPTPSKFALISKWKMWLSNSYIQLIYVWKHFPLTSSLLLCNIAHQRNSDRRHCSLTQMGPLYILVQLLLSYALIHLLLISRSCQ
jgi:hypothetical protein